MEGIRTTQKSIADRVVGHRPHDPSVSRLKRKLFPTLGGTAQQTSGTLARCTALAEQAWVSSLQEWIVVSDGIEIFQVRRQWSPRLRPSAGGAGFRKAASCGAPRRSAKP